MIRNRIPCFLLAAALAATGDSAVRGEDRALLVGIDTYNDPRVPTTPGAAMDARALARIVVERFGFSQAGTELLLDEEATAEAIVTQFQRWLIDGTGPGDRVFFFYAGHGSQLPDESGDEEDGYDETLAPFDADPLSGEHQIRDDVLDGLIAQLVGRRAVLVFDSCHSGTVTRGRPAGDGPVVRSVRFLPRADQLRSLWGGEEPGPVVRGEESDYYVAGSARGADARSFDDPGALGPLTGLVTISAAESGQLAYPLEASGTYRGALSLLLEATYGDGENVSRGVFRKILGGLGQVLGNVFLGTELPGDWPRKPEKVSVDELEILLAKALGHLQEKGLLSGSQTPVVEAPSEPKLKQQPLFGRPETELEAAIVNPIAERQIVLRTVAGRSTYYQGETVTFEIESDHPGYLYLMVFSEERVATCIFPNAQDPSHRIAAGKSLVPTNDRYVFPVQPPFGRDVVVALVADETLRLCDKERYTWDEIYAAVDLRAVHEEFRGRMLRGLGVEAAEGVVGFEFLAKDEAPLLDTGNLVGWQAATLVLQTAAGASTFGMPR